MVRVARTSRNPAQTIPGRQFSLRYALMAVSSTSFATLSCTDAVQEFLAEVTPSALRQAQIFTCPEVGQMRDRMRFGELIDEACYRKKENCTGDGDRDQPRERHSPVEPTGHGFLPYATSYRHAPSLFSTQKSRQLRGVKCQKSFSFRWSRGSDLRLLRLTMDGLPDRHIWGATPCVKDRPRPKVRPN